MEDKRKAVMEPEMKKVIKGERKELCFYIRCVRLFELPDYLNVKHQISSVDVFHHIIQTVLQKQNTHTHIHTLHI